MHWFREKNNVDITDNQYALPVNLAGFIENHCGTFEEIVTQMPIVVVGAQMGTVSWPWDRTGFIFF